MAACCAAVRPDLSAEWIAAAMRVREEIASQEQTLRAQPQLPPVGGWILRCAQGDVRERPVARNEVRGYEPNHAQDLAW